MQEGEKKVLDTQKKVCLLLKTEVVHTTAIDRKKLIRHVVGMIVDFNIEKEVLQVLRGY